MAWDHNFTVQVLYSDGSAASGKEVYAVDTGTAGGSDTGYTDSDGEASLNIQTVLDGFAIDVQIYAGGEKFGPYTVSDGESFTVTLDD